jgi:hypothetical protein
MSSPPTIPARQSSLKRSKLSDRRVKMMRKLHPKFMNYDSWNSQHFIHRCNVLMIKINLSYGQVYEKSMLPFPSELIFGEKLR